MNKNIKNTSIYSVYLKGQKLSADGRPCASSEELTKDEVRVQCAEIIAAKLSEAFASLEVAKELGIFTDEYAEKVLASAKDKDNPHTYRKHYYKVDIYKKLNKALKIANKPLLNEQEHTQEEKPEFE